MTPNWLSASQRSAVDRRIDVVVRGRAADAEEVGEHSLVVVRERQDRVELAGRTCAARSSAVRRRAGCARRSAGSAWRLLSAAATASEQGLEARRQHRQVLHGGLSLSATGFRSLTSGSVFDEKPCSFASVAFDSSSKVGKMSNVSRERVLLGGGGREDVVRVGDERAQLRRRARSARGTPRPCSSRSCAGRRSAGRARRARRRRPGRSPGGCRARRSGPGRGRPGWSAPTAGPTAGTPCASAGRTRVRISSSSTVGSTWVSARRAPSGSEPPFGSPGVSST